LILLENEAQVRDCLSWLDELNGAYLIIALTPFAMYELDKHNMNYKIPDDYYDSQELYELGIDNFRKVEYLCSLIDTAINQSDTEVAKYNIKPAMFSYYHLKIIYDTLAIRMFQLFKIISTESPDIIYFYDGTTYPFGEYASAPYIFYDHRESIYAQLLSLDCWDTPRKRIVYKHHTNDILDDKSDSHHVARIKSNAVAWLQNHPELYSFVLSIKKHRCRGAVNWLKCNMMTSKDIPVLLYGAGYNWDDVNEELHSEGIGPVYRIPDDFNWLKKSNEMPCHDLDYVWTNLLNNEDFMKSFMIYDIDIFPILKERLEYLVKRITFACLISVQETMEMIAKRGIKAVIASTFATCVAHSVAQAAHNSGIPVITWQHGGYGAEVNHPFVKYCDIISSDVHFTFGDGVCKNYIEAAKRYKTELISIGSSSLENIQMGCVEVKSKTKTIVYVTSSFMQNNLNISTPPPFSDTLFWQTQQMIVDVLSKQKKYSIIVKLHPSLNSVTPLQKYVSDNEYENFHFIQREKTLPDLIPCSDAFVIDLPFTTLLQVLMTKKPVFSFTGHVYYNKHAQKLLKKRAVCSEDLNVFLDKLNEFLINDVYNQDVNNTEFLEEHGTTPQKSTASKRAAKELKRVINKF
jgi:hypothetical protein